MIPTFEDSYLRIERATGQREPVLVVARYSGEWQVSVGAKSSRGDSLEHAAFRLANYIESGAAASITG